MSDAKTIAQTIAANLKADVIIANGAPAALGHAYSGPRKNYDWHSGPIAIVDVARRGIREEKYTQGGGGRNRLHYHSSLDLVWVQQDVVAADTDNVQGSDDFLALIENVKVSLRKHATLGGTVLKCAYEEIQVDEVRFDPNTTPHRETTLHFDVLDEIVVTPQG